ncbi:MAG TPA: GNAT family N-acetyltransferase [Gaiellaceae bacterium]|nr:GNAT family N-acetyltransferase [Gaiellaceae bacterium]
MEIRRENFGGTAAQALAGALEAELLATYAGDPGSGGLPAASLFEPPGGVFLVGRVGGEPVACGGIARYDDATAEIRRMYVVPAARGRGCARALLAALEDEARALGYTFVRLETGNLQAAAIGLYASAGYRPIPRYGPFANDPKSLCFEKRLSG